MFCSLLSSRNALPEGVWGGVQRIIKKTLE